jgi:hypothetical protein
MNLAMEIGRRNNTRNIFSLGAYLPEAAVGDAESFLLQRN